ncbi:MAG: hypothetical protein COB35_10805 [Gammaproteobacteria bacterium]|nr:MAG: hypothetical protein COB35_10805 [Gammaproteobacteria bacterium]
MKQFLAKVLNGFAVGLGFMVACGIGALLIFIVYSNPQLADSVKNSGVAELFTKQQPKSLFDIDNYQPAPKIENHLLKNINGNTQIKVPDNFLRFQVSTVEEYYATQAQIKKHGGSAAIYFDDGIYSFPKTNVIKLPNIMILSTSGQANKVILQGIGMRAVRRTDSLFEVYANGFVVDGVTLQNVGNHLIQIKAEKNADFPIIRNSILQNSYQQMIKVSYDKTNAPNNYSDSGLIENCLFQYTAGIGPNFYIGGIDAHGIRNWTIRNNIFRNIASPSKHIAEHAIHIWNNTENNLVENNIIINSDRGIGFGMFNSSVQDNNQNIKFSNYGGIIRNNIIYHSNNHAPFADTGIVIENSPKTIIEGNYIFLEHNYPRAIEYRFNQTSDVIIKNNFTNKNISSRNGGEATLVNNNENLTKVDFILQLRNAINKMPYTVDLSK